MDSSQYGHEHYCRQILVIRYGSIRSSFQANALNRSKNASYLSEHYLQLREKGGMRHEAHLCRLEIWGVQAKVVEPMEEVEGPQHHRDDCDHFL